MFFVWNQSNKGYSYFSGLYNIASSYIGSVADEIDQDWSKLTSNVLLTESPALPVLV